jgi:dTDP-4-amino-4,6-dideoxygalactose transaminase
MLGQGRAITASYGRMAFYYILQAFQFPLNSEVIFPALTFWVVPEMARVLGLKPVFADVDPDTFNIQPEDLERLITPQTRAIVPTHLYGMPCDMESILAIAKKHNLKVIEDCAHSLGAEYRGQPVGTFGHAAIFSFQLLKPLNTYGGGMAIIQDPDIAAAVARLAKSEPWPEEEETMRKLNIGRLQRILIRPKVFTYAVFPLLWASSWTRKRLDVYLWESIRPLDPLPISYRRRFTNVQAILGLGALTRLKSWSQKCNRHAQIMNASLSGIPGVRIPKVPEDRNHVYYQYCLYVPNRDQLVIRCIRRGLDLETLHVDVCSRLPLFGSSCAPKPGAETAAEAVQVPVYASMTDADASRAAACVRQLL